MPDTSLPIRLLAALALAACVHLSVSGVVLAQDAADRLKATREQLELKSKQKSEIAQDIKSLETERQRITQQQIETARLIQGREREVGQIEARVAELEELEQIKQGSLTQRYAKIAGLLAAMQRMGRNPPPVIVTRREDALEMVRSAMLLANAFPQMKSEADALANELAEVGRVRKELEIEKQKREAEVARLTDAQNRLAALGESKKLTMAERQKELSAVSASVAEISRSVSDLSDLIGKLDKTVSEKTPLGEYDREQAMAGPTDPAAGPNAPAPGQPQPKVALAQPPKGPAFELAPSAISANPGRLKPAIPFQQAKAQLPIPAQGKRVISFGDKTQFGSTSKGIVIETRHSAQVTSPCDGWIVYAGEFRSYGQLLIINAGNGYHVLLAGLSRIDVQVGQFILAAEPVGLMQAKAVKTQDSAPVLYVEFRKDGRSVDPDPWWFQGT
jgi:septal ring factor EnvC (AmiA/AmiB activator)